MGRVEQGLVYLIVWILCTVPVSFIGGLVIGVHYNFGFATIFSLVSMFGGIAAALVWFSWYLNNDPRLKNGRR